LIFFILEISTASFFFLWIGAGAVITVVVSLFSVPAPAEYTVFVVSSLLLVIVSRRWAGAISGKSTQIANVDALVGQTGQITKVYPYAPWQGYAKVCGESWRVETEKEILIQMNDEIKVLSVKSNILVVKKVAQGHDSERNTENKP
jgi:membrane protein implicated in regulation of membrane protease activity